MKTASFKRHPMKNQKGASILEILVYMGIAALIYLLVMQGSAAGSDTQKVNAEVNNILNMKTVLKSMFATQRVYTGLDNSVLTVSAGFPEQMRVPGNTALIANGWLTDGVDVAPYNLFGSADDGFEMTWKGIPDGACNDILDKTYRQFEEVEANAVDVTSGVATIRANCTATANELTFRDR